jgi:hypothetical protein
MVKKSLLELVVIIAGVLIALAADRWIKRVDTRAEQSYYITSLIENLRTDSAGFAANQARADSTGSQAMELLLFIESGGMPSGVDEKLFMRRLATMSYYTPTDLARETWDDLVSSGKIGIISDADVRERLSAYYNALDRLSEVERDWETQLGHFEMASWSVESPLGRLALTDNPHLPDSIRVRHQPTRADLDHVRSRFKSDPQLHAALGQAVIIRSASKRYYAAYLAATKDVLKTLRSYAG